MLQTRQTDIIGTNKDIPAIYIPGNNRVPAVLMAHGIMGSKNEYLDTQARIAEKLEEKKIATLRIDFSGHGDSSRDLSDFSLSSQILDLVSSVRWLMCKGYSSIIMLGVSFGAPPAVLVSMLFREIIKKCVLIAPVTDYRKTFVSPLSSWGEENFGAERILYGINHGGLKLDENYVLSPRVLTDMLLADIPTLIRESDVSITIFHGDCDDMVSYEISKALCDSNDRIDLVTMHNTEHGLTEVGDEDFISSQTLKNLDDVVAALQ